MILCLLDQQRGAGISTEYYVALVTKNAPETKKGFVMKVGVGEINTRVLMQMAWNDKEKMMADDKNEYSVSDTTTKDLSSISWDIYNMTQALVSTVEVYPQFSEEARSFLNNTLNSLTAKTKAIVSRLPYNI